MVSDEIYSVRIVLNTDRADAVNVSLPFVDDQLPADISAPWPHVDQSPKRLGKHCVQGIINLVNLSRYGHVDFPWSHTANRTSIRLLMVPTTAASWSSNPRFLSMPLSSTPIPNLSQLRAGLKETSSCSEKKTSSGSKSRDVNGRRLRQVQVI